MSKNYFINGITDLLILSLLDNHDSYMYEIVKSISDFSDGLINISQNTIYTAAYKLEGEGKISEYTKLVGKKRTRVYYHLEPKGKEYLDEISQNYQNTTVGIQRIFTTLEGMEKVVRAEEGVETEVEQNMQNIHIGDSDTIPDKKKIGTQIPKKPCFGY